MPALRHLTCSLLFGTTLSALGCQKQDPPSASSSIPPTNAVSTAPSATAPAASASAMPRAVTATAPASASGSARPVGAAAKGAPGSKVQELVILDPVTQKERDIVACAGQEQVAVVLPAHAGADDWKVVPDKGLGAPKREIRPGCLGPNTPCEAFTWNVLKAKPDAYSVKFSSGSTKLDIQIRIDARLPCD